MKRAIVTGGTGFVGRALVEELRRRGPEAEIVPVGTAAVDLADEDAWFAWLEGLGGEVDHLFHLAALYKAGDWPVLIVSDFAKRLGHVSPRLGWAPKASSTRRRAAASRRGSSGTTFP